MSVIRQCERPAERSLELSRWRRSTNSGAFTTSAPSRRSKETAKGAARALNKINRRNNQWREAERGLERVDQRAKAPTLPLPRGVRAPARERRPEIKDRGRPTRSSGDVKPFIKRQKNDAADAEAICE